MTEAAEAARVAEAEAEGAREAAVATALAWAWRVPGVPEQNRGRVIRD